MDGVKSRLLECAHSRSDPTRPIAHQVGVRETAILASILPSAGITLIQKPHETDEFVALIEQIADNRPIPCGLVENFTNHRNRH
jgi:hypothetical protein